ncbi:MAG: NAD(P)H dehydrogenase [Burkholderiales bacterium PBB1]|nr:MAG: NAD(P)H dehydrogenase [Burkholderiales bacterium PBB1]
MASTANHTPPIAEPSPDRAPEVLVLLAHPALEQSRVNQRLLRAIADLGSAPASTARIGVRDLYALYPDYLIDVQAERSLLATAQLVVWQHPIHWYGMPPLMKLWLDEVLGFGWAYGPGGHALAGKHLWLVASTGSPEEAYHPSGHNRYFFDAFLPPYEQTATLCGMRFLPPLLLHGAHRVDEAELNAHAALYARRLASHPDWPELADLAECPACVVPPLARPSDITNDTPPALAQAPVGRAA